MNNLLKDFKIQPTKLRGENMSIYEASITNPKKQLEFYKQLSEQLQQEIERLKKQPSSKILQFETQQKEFIKYLEDEINDIKEQIKNYDIWHEVGTDINFLILKKQFNEEILSKYKEIVGVEDVR